MIDQQVLNMDLSNRFAELIHLSLHSQIYSESHREVLVFLFLLLVKWCNYLPKGVWLLHSKLAPCESPRMSQKLL